MNAELPAIVDAALAARREGTPVVLATVVGVRGSSYRKPGARMLVSEDRWLCGSISGGCLEGDVVKKGFWHTRAGKPALVTYDLTSDDPSRLGTGCDGVVDVLFEREPWSWVDFVAGCLEKQERGVVATVIDPAAGDLGSRVFGEEAARAGGAAGPGRAGVFVETVVPPLALFVLGAGHDAVPLATFGASLGWDVRVFDRHGRVASRERFAGLRRPILGGTEEELRPRIDACERAAAVVMAHDYERDRASLAMLLESRAFYIGMLGPRRRTERMLAELGRAFDPRIHAPVGLAIGGESPAEIALAIAAEVQQASQGQGRER